ncbi:MAG: hypothetical protein LUC33_05815 [Prevotellaceae bacterium]|nr:hypothetical protein [Prevotellaceae bacterium]
MTNEGKLYIQDLNGKWQDAWTTWGVTMGDGFVSALETPAPMKDYIEGKSRLLHGKTVITANARMDSRDVTLQFNLHGRTTVDDLTNWTTREVFTEEKFRENRAAFLALLEGGAVVLKFTYQDGEESEVYRLVYKKPSKYERSRTGLFCAMTMKFEEPDPSDREE